MNKTILYTKLKSFGCKDPEGLAKQLTMLQSGRGSKYNNIIVEYKGGRYHSLSEVYYHWLLENDPRVVNIETQVRYRLENMEGKKTLSYIADFVVTDKKGREYVIDVKGRLTNENKVKLGYFFYVYKKPVILISTTGPEKFTTSFLDS